MRKLSYLLALSTVLVATHCAFGEGVAVVPAGDNPSGPTTVTTYNNRDNEVFSIVEIVAYDGASGSWHKELVNGLGSRASGFQFPIVEHITNAGPSSWTDWHEEILLTPGDFPFPDFLFTAGSLQVDRNGVALIPGLDYTLVPTTAAPGLGVTPTGDWVALSIFFGPSGVIQPGDTLGITKSIFEVFGDGDIWDLDEVALLAEYPSVPEPGSLVLAGLGFGVLGFVALRKKYRRT